MSVPPVDVPAVPDVLDWVPTPDAVARLLRARTKDKSGVEVGAWTEDTRPTLTEVAGIIQDALSDMTSVIGVAVPARCVRGAQGTAALLAACLIELSYFPEQVRSDRSAYTEYRSMYDKQLDLLIKCVEEGAAGDAAGGFGTTMHNVPATPATTYEWYGTIPSYAGGPLPRPNPDAQLDDANLGMATALGPWGDIPGDHWPEPENPQNWARPFKPPSEPPEVGDLPVGELPAKGTVIE